jgi:hypothetical protein
VLIVDRGTDAYQIAGIWHRASRMVARYGHRLTGKAQFHYLKFWKVAIERKGQEVTFAEELAPGSSLAGAGAREPAQRPVQQPVQR